MHTTLEGRTGASSLTVDSGTSSPVGSGFWKNVPWSGRTNSPSSVPVAILSPCLNLTSLTSTRLAGRGSGRHPQHSHGNRTSRRRPAGDRVLRRGGSLALLWNVYAAGGPIKAELDRILDRHIDPESAVWPADSPGISTCRLRPGVNLYTGN